MPNEDEIDLPYRELEASSSQTHVHSLPNYKTLLKANLLDMCSSSTGTLTWEAIFYAPTFENPYVTYLTKIPAMGLLPNIPGMIFASLAENIRSAHITDNKERKKHVKQFAKDYLLIFFLIDLVYQPLQDSVHSLDAEEWEGLADSFFNLKQVFLNIFLMGGGLSIFHYYLTKWIRDSEHLSWKESATIGPQYFFFWLSDYFLDMFADEYHLRDATVDFIGTSICTGVATFSVNTIYDVLNVCHEKSLIEQVVKDKPKTILAEYPEDDLLLESDLEPPSCGQRMKKYWCGFFYNKTHYVAANEMTSPANTEDLQINKSVAV